MELKPCQPYHAVLAGKTLLSMPDGKSTFKIYFINLTGRANPVRYEWSKATISQDQFAARLQNMQITGIGFVTAFPHVTKIFRFDPAAETVLNVRAFSTPDMAPLDLKRPGDYLEFACYAEALLAAAEYRLWATAETIGQYLSAFSSFDDGKIISNTKLADYYNSHDEAPHGEPLGNLLRRSSSSYAGRVSGASQA